MSANADRAMLLYGVPSINKAVFHRVRHGAHDPVAFLTLPGGRTVLIVRDVELEQVRAAGRADEVHTYEDFTPAGGLSGDREVRAAQAVAECCRCHGVRVVHADRTLPLLAADELRRAGVAVELDRELGVRERRQKSPEEVGALRVAQAKTEKAIEHACTLIARARARADGVLLASDGSALTSERVMAEIDAVLAAEGCVSDGHIVAGGPQGADCHFHGAGPLRTGQPVIVDVFPRDRASGYHGDCTRCVVHGDIPDAVARMHAAVADAKRAAIDATRAEATGEAVHRAAITVIEGRGYRLGFPPADAPAGFCSMPHGTGHGLGLDLKEPPLLDFKGPELLAGDAVTVEPGLYAPGLGGIRLEDLVIVRDGACENLNRLPESLVWS